MSYCLAEIKGDIKLLITFKLESNGEIDQEINIIIAQSFLTLSLYKFFSTLFLLLSSYSASIQ